MFVSYRREDTRHVAGRLADRLGRVLGRIGSSLREAAMQPGGLSVLISGAGIAGATLAALLGRAGHQVTVVERDQGVRSSGNPVDVREGAYDVAAQPRRSDPPARRRNQSPEVDLRRRCR